MKRSPFFIVLVACWLVALACSSPPADGRFVATAPDRASFPVVADLLVHRCGSLYCHGMTARNFRLYGYSGLRLSPADKPSAPSQKSPTTPAEYDEDYLSVVGLEPEILSQIVQQGGANPERLTLMRKAEGIEDHKGEVLFFPGDDQIACMDSWFASKTDSAKCISATQNTP